MSASKPSFSCARQQRTAGASRSAPQTRVCVVCGKTDNLLRCSRCKSAFYCNKDHQRLDWKRHKKQCSQLPGSADSQQNQVVEQVLPAVNPAKNKSGQEDDEADSQKLIKDKSTAGKSQLHKEDIRSNLHTKEERDGWTPPITYEGSSEDTILGARAELLNPFQGSRLLENPANKSTLEMPERHHNEMKNFPEVRLRHDEELSPSFLPRSRNNFEEIDDICRNVIRDMNRWGVCVVNNFLGNEKGLAVLDEVLNLYSAGMFRDGQLVSHKAGASDLKTIRGDQITWLDGKEKNSQNISMLISKVDAIIIRANKMYNNGKMGDHMINGRTKVICDCKIRY